MNDQKIFVGINWLNCMTKTELNDTLNITVIHKTQIGFLGVKTRFFTNFFSHFEDESEHFASFFGSKNVEIKDFGLGFRLEEKVVL